MITEVNNLENQSSLVRRLGEFLIRYGLVLVLGWIGAMKFTAYEAEGIKTLVETSPFMSWMYKVFSLQATSNIIGVAEITAAVLIAIRPISGKTVGDWQCAGSADISGHADLSLFFARMGTESRRLSRAFRLGRISAERHSAAGRGPVYAGRFVDGKQIEPFGGRRAMDIDEVVKRIVERRSEVPEKVSLLVGVSGIDGCGKGYIAAQIEARLAQHAFTSAVINVDGWLNLPDKRFDSDAPAERFYESAIRFAEFFSDLVIPLRDQRSVHLVADFVEETAHEYRKHVYNIKNIDVILVEGIFLFKQAYRSLFDLAIWVDCTFATALARALQRAQEGLPPAETIAAYETIYFPAQRIHFHQDNPRGSADLILDNDFCSP